MVSRLIWWLAGLSVTCLVADTIVVSRYQPLLSEQTVAAHGWPFVPGASVGAAAMGAIIVSRRPRHPVGWLLSVVGTTTSLSIVLEAYGIWVVDESGPGPMWLGHASGVVSTLLGGPLALSGLAVMFLLVPDGHWLSHRWRYVAWASGLGLMLFCLAVATIDPADMGGHESPRFPNRLGEIAGAVGFLLITVAVLASVVCMVLRLRGSTGALRQQMRWVLASATGVAVGLAALIVEQAKNGGDQTWASALPLDVAYFLLPICIAVAALRYRLYDVDVIISRAVLVTLATAFAAAGYVLLVVVVGQSLSDRTDRYWPSVVASALVALAFQPLRRSAVRLADRLAYGDRAAPYDALAAFNRAISESVDLADVPTAVAEAAGRAAGAEHTVVRYYIGSNAVTRATWSADEGTEIPPQDAAWEVPIADDAGRLGILCLHMPRGRGGRAQDSALVGDIARHSAVAFRNAVLQEQLAAHAVLLDEQTTALAASRRRLLEGGDAERRRLEAAIARDVMPLLTDLADSLRHVELPADGDAAEQVEPLIGRATQALDALRELTRGIFPTVLTRSGLRPALTAYFTRAGHPGCVRVEEAVQEQRFPASVEAAIYFCCVAVDSAQAHGTAVDVAVSLEADELVAAITSASHAVDLATVIDRLHAVGGRLTRTPVGDLSEPGEQVVVRVPVVAHEEAVAATQASTSWSGPKAPLGMYAAAPDPSWSNSSSS